MKKPLYLLSAILIALTVTPTRSEAASTLVFKVAPVRVGKARQGRIYAGPDGVMTLGGHGAKSLEEAHEVARRLNALAEQGLPAEEIVVKRSGSARIILGGTRRIVQVDRAVARVHRSSPARLARTWAENLRAQFRRPYLSLRAIVVPVGEARTAPINGNVVGELRVGAATAVVEAVYDAASNLVRVVGRDVGRTEVVLWDDRTLLRVPVRSAKYAARLTAPLAAVATGDPAPSGTVSRAVSAAVAANLALEPGAWANVRPLTDLPASLARGETASVPVRIAVTGEGYLPYVTRRAIVVRNEDIPNGHADILMVSNTPERLLSHGLWFEGTLEDVQSARMLYHHVNGTSSTGELVVELWNLGDELARVHVVVGSGGPSADESWAGHRAAAQFLDHRSSNSGWIVPVSPGMTAPILFQRMTPGATASGVLALRSLEPASLRVRLYFSPRRPRRVPHRIRSYSPSPVLGKCHYPQPRKEISSSYVVGRGWAFVTIGREAVPGIVEGDRLAGNYGVIYDISLDISNPTTETTPVEIVMEPAGGSARGVVLIDGTPIQVAMIGRRTEARVMRYVLAPGEKRRVHIETMPQSGSNYPVRLVTRAI
jgi:hypothetical protein